MFGSHHELSVRRRCEVVRRKAFVGSKFGVRHTSVFRIARHYTLVVGLMDPFLFELHSYSCSFELSIVLSIMARKSKASSKQVDDTVTAKASNKKRKVSDGTAVVAAPEVKDKAMVVEEDSGPWDGIRVIGESETVACRVCEAKATGTWDSHATGDQWDMCDKCQMEDFGEDFQGGKDAEPAAGEETDTKKNPHVTMENVQTDDQVEETAAMDSLEKTASCNDSSSRESLATEKDPSMSASSLSANPKDIATVSEDSSPSEAPSVASSDEDDLPAAQTGMVIPPTQGDTPMADAVKQGKDAEGNEVDVIPPTQDDTPMADAVKQGKDAEGNEVAEDDEEDEGQYDLKKILSLQDIDKDDAILCSQDCDLAAFGLYVNSANPKDRWYYCLDCQENDFDGWPPLEELPVKYLDPEHLRVMAQKCSHGKDPSMPVFSAPPIESLSCSLSPKAEPNTIAVTTANFVTPPPTSLAGSKEASTLPSSLVNSKPVGGGAKANVSRNAKALELHKKWLETAQAMGGKEARIVVAKPAAKKLIFDFLYDAFQPMNITQIYKVLPDIVAIAIVSRVDGSLTN